MLKISSGQFGGREITQPKTVKTRPVMERTRHAIFQTLGDASGLKVLDLYAGSGALGFEALSLGAESAMFVDSAKVAVEAIKPNAERLQVEDRVSIHQQKVEQFLQTNQDKFNIIFFDPPYAEFRVDILEQAAVHLLQNGIIVVSCSAKTELTSVSKLELIKQKTYGDTQIAYFR